MFNGEKIIENNATPLTFGCREMDHRPVVINLPAFSLFCLNTVFCTSATTSKTMPNT